HSLCHELRVIAEVDEEHPVELLALEHGPAPTEHLIHHLLVALPGPFDAGLPIPHAFAVVDLASNEAELELSVLALLELDERLDFLVDVDLVPCAHRNDVPAPQEWRLRLAGGLLLRHNA